jgi:hypothetical protein
MLRLIAISEALEVLKVVDNMFNGTLDRATD